MEIVGFSDDDLAANRKNALSKGQVASLRRQAGRWFDVYALALLLGLLADFAIIWLGTRFGEEFGTIAVKVVIATLIAFMLFAYAWFMRGGEMSVIKQQTVEIVEGYVHPYIHAYRHLSEHRIEIGEVTFSVKREVFQAFEPRIYYRIYYAPIFKRILSVEDGPTPLNDFYFETMGHARLDPTTITPAAKPRKSHTAAP